MEMPPAEQDFLVLAARPGPNEGVRQRLRELAAAGLDWAWIADMAVEHAMSPALLRAIDAAVADLAPAQVLAGLRGVVRANTLRNLDLTAELVRVVDLMQGAGVRVAPFKGPVLAAMAYGDLSHRMISDLDVIVPRAEVAPAARGLLENGYRFSRPGVAAAEELMISATNHAQLVHRDRGIALELHWAFAPSYFRMRLEDTPIWERLGPVKVGGTSVKTLSVEDTLIELCLHAAKHRWARLEWLSCVAHFVARNDVDWEAVTARTAELGLRRALDLALALLPGVLGVEPPPGPRGRDPRVARLVTTVRASLFAPGNTVITEVPLTRFHLAVRERRRDRVLPALLVLITPTEDDVLAVRLPRAARPLYRLRRLGQVLARDPRSNWRLATGTVRQHE